MERRKFIRNFIRWSMILGLSGISGLLAYRRGKAGDAECEVLPVCNGCSFFTACSKSAKKIRMKNERYGN